ncbi:MAG: efflux RND transporter periplasmic adaptor subunit [Hyphomonadaceae bacterium]
MMDQVTEIAPDKLFLADKNAGADSSADAARRRKRVVLFAGLAASAALLISAYFAYDHFVASRHVTTDNAYVGADVAQVTPLVGGPVREVLVEDTERVRAGDVLVRLDDSDARIALARARAQLAAAHANLDKARIDRARREDLTASGSISGEELTGARNAYSTAAANLAATEAALDQAELNLDRTIIRAPVDGVVSRRQVQVGQMVQPGAPLMVVAPLHAAYVDANFRENQLDRVHPGQPVRLTSDLYGERVVYEGRVVGFSAGTGAAFALVPAQNATGNWIKVVQRLPVRIELDPEQLEQHPLQVGLSMNVDVDVSNR